LLVDEAHAVGAIGPGGRGEAARQGVEPDFLVGTFGKAYGAFGAFVVGPPELHELFVSRGRTFVYTTGLPEPIAAAALTGLRLADDERRERLADRTARFRRGLTQLGIPALGSAHIVPVVLGERTMAMADELLARGVFALGIRPPTVPAGTERIRFSLSAEHTDEQIDRLLDILSTMIR
jgi:8-amino-7-oxononanoate synthase